jgi:radical SAM-linked protein
MPDLNRHTELEPQLQTEPQLTRQRVRLVYEKGEAIKFISHQDEFRLWERSLRRAGLPLLYKQGFNPQPHMQFASPLGVGFTGLRELLDITLSPPVALDELQRRVVEKLPPGVVLHFAKEVPLNAAAPQSLLIGADYTIRLYAEPGELSGADLNQRIAAFLGHTTLWRERERKGQPYRYNLRPLVFALRYEGYRAESEEHRIFLRVQQRAGATGRPDEVVDELRLDKFARTLQRDRLYFADNPEDAALFAAYPVIHQEAISHSSTRKQRRKRSPEKRPRTSGGRSISDRAGDEFE